MTSERMHAHALRRTGVHPAALDSTGASRRRRSAAPLPLGAALLCLTDLELLDRLCHLALWHIRPQIGEKIRRHGDGAGGPLRAARGGTRRNGEEKKKIERTEKKKKP